MPLACKADQEQPFWVTTPTNSSPRQYRSRLLLSAQAQQAGRLHGNGLVYQLLNLFGALGVLVSLLGTFNLPVFLLEGAWVAVSAYGIARSFKAKSRAPA